ncbi:MAG: hypothetical protein H6979_02885 [Chromatiales bacterium]|nr:hypothetical protein [Chromatiales bacterium]
MKGEVTERTALEDRVATAKAAYRVAAAEAAAGNAEAKRRMPDLWQAIGSATGALRDFDAIGDERLRLEREQEAASQLRQEVDTIATSLAAVDEVAALAVVLADQVKQIASTLNKAKDARDLAAAGMDSAPERDYEAFVYLLSRFETGLAAMLGQSIEEMYYINISAETQLQRSDTPWAESVALRCEAAAKMLQARLTPKEAA